MKTNFDKFYLEPKCEVVEICLEQSCLASSFGGNAGELEENVWGNNCEGEPMYE